MLRVIQNFNLRVLMGGQAGNLIPLIVFIFYISCSSTLPNEQPGRLIDEVQSHFAPDKRVALFDVTWNEQSNCFVGETNLPDAKKALLDSMESLSIPYSDSIRILESRPALVNVSVCNIRSHPRHSAELSTQSLLGTRLRIYKERSGWYYVQTPDGYLGWLDGGGFVFISENDLREWTESRKVVVLESFALVIKDNEVVSDVVAGNILKELERNDGNIRVEFPDGRSGWIASSAVEDYSDFLEVNLPLRDNILKTAKGLMGRPYMWGGTSVRAMDCSGFTKTVFYLNGLELPRDASQQVEIGREISTDTTLKNLQTGDLLFFGRKASEEGPERITHVAIYLGDGKIIHASSRVQIESLQRRDPDFAEHRLLTLIKAKRVFDHVGELGLKRLVEHPLY